MHESIDSWHIVISGFLQHEGKSHGMVSLWRSLRSHASPTCCVELRSWNDDWRALAELIYRCRSHRPKSRPHVKIYGYSWGGYSATLLARELARREIVVDAMVLSDAVYRHWYRLGWWRAFSPWSYIEIPNNVREVTWFVQAKDWPRGHELIAEDEKRTLIAGPKLAPSHVGHCEMDDLTAFHDACRRVAA